jgi:hypothetical protein
MSPRQFLPVMLLALLIFAATSAPADVAFEPANWFSETVKAALLPNEYRVGMESFALSPHDPPQLFVGFANDKHRQLQLHGVFTCWADGSHMRILVADDDEYSREAQWSPDGRYVAYVTCLWDTSSTTVKSAHLWIVDVVSGQRWCVSQDYVGGLQWQPDSQGLLFWRYRSGDGTSELHPGQVAPQACRVTAPWETASPQALNVPSLRGGVFSPDGRSVAYWGHPAEEGVDGKNRILIADVATGQVRSLEDRQKLRVFAQGPGGMKRLLWSPDSQRLFLQLYMVCVESSTQTQFIVDVPIETYRPVPSGLGSYLHPIVWDFPSEPKPKQRPRSKEAHWVDATWIPGTHRLLCPLWDVFGTDMWAMIAGETSPQYVAWVVIDADTGQVEPVMGLPERNATGGPWGGQMATGGGMIAWSGRYLHFQNDFWNLYRVR